METTTKTTGTRPRKNPGAAPAGYRLTPATEAALQHRAGKLSVAPAVLLEIAVAAWLAEH